MHSALLKKLLAAGLAVGAVWLGARYVLPVVLPFFLGALLAIAAEPAVDFGIRKLGLRRGLASGIGVSLTVLLGAGLVSLAAAVAVRELGHLAKGLPNLESGAATLQNWLADLANRAPEGVRTPAQQMVREFFSDSTPLIRQLSDRLPGVLGNLVSGVGTGALGIGTGIVAAFLISVRLPGLRQKLAAVLPDSWYKKTLPTLKKLRTGLWGWVKAQAKLSAVTWIIVSIGFLVLGVSYGPVWAVLVAVVDAVPVLGTGTVLVPWAIVCFLQGNTLQGVGLLCTYAAAAITRTVLEPRLVGKHLGLDPLATLVALYAGFRLWGIPGLLLTPILASAGKSLLTEGN